MSLELNKGWLYTLVLQRHGAAFDELEEVTISDLEYVGPGWFSWSTEEVFVFLDRSGLLKGEGLRHRIFRARDIVAAEPTQPEGKGDEADAET